VGSGVVPGDTYRVCTPPSSLCGSTCLCQDQNLDTLLEPDRICCYARQEKVWVMARQGAFHRGRCR
jgi:hypothetical protein